VSCKRAITVDASIRCTSFWHQAIAPRQGGFRLRWKDWCRKLRWCHQDAANGTTIAEKGSFHMAKSGLKEGLFASIGSCTRWFMAQRQGISMSVIRATTQGVAIQIICSWVPLATTCETAPIKIGIHLVKITQWRNSRKRKRLRLKRGYWLANRPEG
jgi:hypothetical protein